MKKSKKKEITLELVNDIPSLIRIQESLYTSISLKASKESL